MYREWSERFGDCGVRLTGGLVIIGQDSEDRQWAADVLQSARSLGIPLEVLTPKDVRNMETAMQVDDIDSALFCPEAGHGDGYSATTSFMTQAKELGVTFMNSTHVIEILTKKDRVIEVKTALGDTISTSTVVLAGGAWSGPLAKTAGVDLPVTPRRVCAGILKRPPEIPQHVTVSRDRAIGTYWRMEGPDQTLLGIRNREVMPTCDPDNYPQTIDDYTKSMWHAGSFIECRQWLTPNGGSYGLRQSYIRQTTIPYLGRLQA